MSTYSENMMEISIKEEVIPDFDGDIGDLYNDKNSEDKKLSDIKHGEENLSYEEIVENMEYMHENVTNNYAEGDIGEYEYSIFNKDLLKVEIIEEISNEVNEERVEAGQECVNEDVCVSKSIMNKKAFVKREIIEENPNEIYICSNVKPEEVRLENQMPRSPAEVPGDCIENNESLSDQIDEQHYSTIMDGSNSFCCSFCLYRSCKKSRVNRHLNSVHADALEVMEMECGSQIYEEDSKDLHYTTQRVDDGSLIRCCSFCNFKSVRESTLKKHLNSLHVTCRPFPCTMCDYRATNDGQLQRHIVRDHFDVKSFKCTECDFKTTNNSSLKRHVDNVHLKLRPHECSLCDYKSNRKKSLDVHVNYVHLKLKPFQCPDCEFATNLQRNLQIHVERTHLELKPFKCPHCNYSSYKKSQMDHHVKGVHLKQKNFKCLQCEYTTSDKYHLGRHTRIHSKKKRHYCTLCSFSAVKEGNLKMHINLKHLKLHQLKCDLCDYETSEKKSLLYHMKTHLS